LITGDSVINYTVSYTPTLSLKLFRTSNMEIVKCCQSLFGCALRTVDKALR